MARRRVQALAQRPYTLLCVNANEIDVALDRG